MSRATRDVCLGLIERRRQHASKSAATTITTMMSAPYPAYPASPPAAQYVPHPELTPGAHPFLREPKLYVTGLSPQVSDADLAHAFEYCVPFRPMIIRDGTGQPINGTR